MTEQTLNTIIGHSLDWSYKISDDSRGKKPFDSLGVFQGRPVYQEAKMLKRPEAFPWDRLEDHQIANLKRIKELIPDAYCLFIVCVDYGRSKKRVFIFQDPFYIHDRKFSDEKSIKKKEWDKRTNYVTIVKDQIDFTKMLEFTEEQEHGDV